jgi:deazaflavin-dependent oxidoreductase (nitroreductase family)
MSEPDRTGARASHSARRLAMNQEVIDEFRAHAGVVGGAYARIPLLLLHHIGARTGIRHISPLAYLAVGDAYVLIAANGGREQHPGWYHNLLAHPRVEVEVGNRLVAADAREAEGEERDRLVALDQGGPRLLEPFQSRTARRIPLLVLEPVRG